MERITVREAARFLQTTPLTVRVAMEQGILPIGIVVKKQQRNTYLVYKELLQKWATGREQHETEH